MGGAKEKNWKKRKGDHNQNTYCIKKKTVFCKRKRENIFRDMSA